MATLHESARHGSHRADDDFSAFQWNSKAQMTVVYQFQQWYKLDGGAVVESCYATKRDSPQIGREGDDAIVIFQVAGVRSVQEWLRHTTDISLWKSSISQSLELLEVKVPIGFLVAGCFSRPRDGH